MSWLPNAISLLRMALVLPAAWLLWEQEYSWALLLVTIAGISDGLDGYLARRYNWFSRFGAIIDPLADKFLVAVMVIMFALLGIFPGWLLAIIIGRDVLIVAGGVLYRVLFGPFDMAPSLLSKLNTALQITVVVIELISLCNYGDLSALCAQLVNPYGYWVLAIVGSLSGLHYVLSWGQRSLMQLRAGR